MPCATERGADTPGRRALGHSEVPSETRTAAMAKRPVLAVWKPGMWLRCDCRTPPSRDIPNVIAAGLHQASRQSRWDLLRDMEREPIPQSTAVTNAGQQRVGLCRQALPDGGPSSEWSRGWLHAGRCRCGTAGAACLLLRKCSTSSRRACALS